jgi:hypothetical protein
VLDTISWVTPLLLLPGVGLLLVSCSNRYEAVHEEIHKLLDERSESAAGCAVHVLRRARVLRLALVGLYAAAALLAAGGLVGAIGELWLAALRPLAWGVTVTAVASVVVSAVALVREASLSLSVVREHAREIESRSE